MSVRAASHIFCLRAVVAFCRAAMKITVMTSDERFLSLDVEPDELVENVKALLEVETGIPLHEQQLMHHGKEIPNSAHLSAIGIVESDLIMMVVLPSSSGSSNPGDLALNADGSALNPTALQQHLRNDPKIISQLLEGNPQLAQAVLGGDVEAFQSILRQQHLQKLEFQRRQQEEIELLNADPFNLEAQRKIEDAIRQKNIDENWEAALEHNPEAFARVIMLYVDVEVNGVPIKAFVDSGAQTTIISKGCAERCGLLRLLDKRYVGIARGVGQSEIVGRIHVAPLKIGKKYYLCSFTVLDQPDIELIFGLDMLRKHQCSIDLKDNVLHVGGGELSVPFLQEKDLPAQFREEKNFRESTSAQDKGASTSAARPSPQPARQPVQAPSPSSAPSRETSTPLSSTDMEAKIKRLMELGFDRQSVVQALSLFGGNEEQAASYLFGG